MDLARIVLAVLALGVLVVVHEAGHFLVARWGGMKVSRFSVGFGPILIRRRWGETDFTLSAIPFGGYVQIDGMHPEDGTDPDDPKSYLNRPRHLRAAAILAGPAANYLLAFVMLFVFFAGFAVREVAQVQDVLPKSPAEVAGLSQGDRIVGAEGTPFRRERDLGEAIRSAEGSIRFDVQRDGQDIVVEVLPKQEQGLRVVGIRYQAVGAERIELGLGEAFLRAGEEVGLLTVRVFSSLLALFSRPKSVSFVGPPGIVAELSNQLKVSVAGTFRFVAQLSIMLGFFNLLPIPALDGARLMFLAIGAIRRREVEPRLEAVVHGMGFLALLGMLIVVSWFDVLKLQG